MNRRLYLLLLILLGLVVLHLVTPPPRSALVAIAEPPRERERRAPSDISKNTSPLSEAQREAAPARGAWPNRPPPVDEPIDIFATQPPPAPPPLPSPAELAQRAANTRPPPPPPPTAPPLPYTVIGDWTADGATVVFLTGAQGTIAARTGDTLAGLYHVEQADHGILRVTYLPLHKEQQMVWSASR